MIFATIVDRAFLPSVYALLQSMQENCGLAHYEFIIQSLEKLTTDEEKTIQRLCPNSTILEPKALGEFQIDLNLIERKHLIPSLQKLTLFNLPLASNVCYLDVDMICLRPIPEIESFEHFTVTPDFGHGLGPFILRRQPLNGGFFVFHPDKELFNGLQEYARTLNHSLRLAEQTLLTEYLYKFRFSEIKFKDIEWNTLKEVYFWERKTWEKVENKIRFLHFAGRWKPWHDNEEDESMYKPLNDLWRSYYQRAMQ